MEKIKFLILGAGPAGLTFANCLKSKGEESFLVLEGEAQAGGLCRSVIVDQSPFDIGGGHFLDVRRPLVNEFLFRFMPEQEWELFQRDSRIQVDGKLVGHPLEANIWQFDLEQQVAYLTSIAKAGCNRMSPCRKDLWNGSTGSLGRELRIIICFPTIRRCLPMNWMSLEPIGWKSCPT